MMRITIACLAVCLALVCVASVSAHRPRHSGLANMLEAHHKLRTGQDPWELCSNDLVKGKTAIDADEFYKKFCLFDFDTDHDNVSGKDWWYCAKKWDKSSCDERAYFSAFDTADHLHEMTGLSEDQAQKYLMDDYTAFDPAGKVLVLGAKLQVNAYLESLSSDEERNKHIRLAMHKDNVEYTACYNRDFIHCALKVWNPGGAFVLAGFYGDDHPSSARFQVVGGSKEDKKDHNRRNACNTATAQEMCFLHANCKNSVFDLKDEKGNDQEFSAHNKKIANEDKGHVKSMVDFFSSGPGVDNTLFMCDCKN